MKAGHSKLDGYSLTLPARRPSPRLPAVLAPLPFAVLAPPPARLLILFPGTDFLFSPQRTRSVGRGRSKCPSYHPPTPYTLSPLLKGGEGRGEGGSYTHVPCLFGTLLVTLYHLKSCEEEVGTPA